MRLLIGIPSYDYMHAEFVKCLGALLQKAGAEGVSHELFICNGTLVHVARDKIACKAINEGFSHVLWLDADMIFRPEILGDLLDNRVDMVSGIAHSRRKPFASCLFSDLSDLNHLTRFEDYPSQPFRVAGCGFACVLIRTEVLRAVQMTHKTCFLPMAEWGEDLSFCKRATALGFDIWADPHVRLGHIGHEVIWPEDHQRYLEDLKRGG